MPSNSAKTVRFRLTLILSLLLLPLIAYGVLADRLQKETEDARARREVRELAQIALQPTNDIFSGTERLFRGLAEEPDIRGGPSCDSDLQRLRAAMPEYRALSITDATGTVTCSSDPETKGAPVAVGQPIAPLLRADRLEVVAQQDGAGAAASMAAILPWRNTDGTTAGAIVATLDPSRLGAGVSAADLPPDSRLYLFDAAGARLDARRDLPAELQDRARLTQLLKGGDDQSVVETGDAIRWIFVAQPLVAGNATALFGFPVRAASPADTYNLTLIAIAFWLGGIVIAWLLADWVVARPLRRLSAGAEALGAGRSDAPLAIGGPAEVAAVAQELAALAGRVAEREREVEEAIATREAMLREIHHRVKNNLQIVTSLLNIQAKTVEGETARRVFGEIQTRVRALALVHRYLYESDDLKSVNLGAFLKELAASLQLSHGISDEQVAIEIDAEEVWDVSDRAVPLALFMTEAMTNALKHAFPEGRRGLIRVVLRTLPDAMVRFSVEDNGIGLSDPQPEAQGRASLGMSLIKAFARQVDGKLTISGPPGTIVAIEFANKNRALDAAPIRSPIDAP